MQKYSLSDYKKRLVPSIKTGKFPFIKKPPFLNLIYISLFINVIAIVGVFFISRFLPPEVPLFYGLPEGEDQLVKTQGLALAPLVSLGITILNIILSSIIESDLLKKILIVIGFCVTIFSSVTLLQIVLLVGNF